MTKRSARIETAALLLLLVPCACSGGGAAGSSDAGASCSSARDCPVYACSCPNGATGSNAACANGVCASAESACQDIGCHAASAGGPFDAGSSPTGDAGNPTGDAGNPQGAPTVYCSNSDPDTCVCGHTADVGTTGASCSVGSLGSSAVCCGTQGWPTQGTCSCSKIACQQYSADTCICGAYTTTGGPLVGSCSGMTCCKSTGPYGQEWCSCWTNLSQCLPGDTPVGSCGVADIGCQSGEATLSSCH